MNQEFTDKTHQEIEAYIMHSMSEEEITSFESKINEDDLLKQEVLLQQSIHQAFNENDWNNGHHSDEEKGIKNLTNKLSSNTYKKASQNINNAADAYFSKMEGKAIRENHFPFYKIAIAVSVLLFISFLFFFSSNSLESQYKILAQWDDIPSVVEKGASGNTVAKGEELFRTGKYNDVINFYASSQTDSPYSFIYLGISYLELNNHEKALQVFDQLIATNSIESSRGYWYKLLVYIKMNDKNKAREMLNIILKSEDNYNYQKALLLSERKFEK